MSIHFAPQWVKPIKPSGGSVTTPTTADQSPTALNSSQTHHQKNQPTSSSNTPSSQVPFPALSSSLNSPLALSSSGNAPNPPMSYSRATHTPASPGFPNDGSYFPASERSNGSGPDPHPFRYTREQILGLYDEDKLKSMPIEFVDLLDRGLSVVAPQPRRPLGMREASEAERKILSSSVHPPMPRRPQPGGGGGAGAGGPGGAQTTADTNANGHTPRRGVANVTRDPTQPNGRGFGGFGRGEGGALAGAIGKPGIIGGGAVQSPGDGKAPGVLGGGFGGVGKRMVRGRNDGAEASSPADGARPWRVPRGASGNFEGVLGFNGPQTANPAHAPIEDNEDTSIEISQPVPQSAPVTGGWRERLAAKQEAKKEAPPAEQPAEGLGSPWSGDQKQWRAPIGQDGPTVPLDLPIANAPTSMSVIASPAATPVPDRDATIDLSAPGPPPAPRAQQLEPEVSQETLDAIQWYYLDPQQQEHGPFVATQMHDWYSESYFQDALPVRRESETGFYPLGELKMTTGNPVRPFVSPPRPAPPPAMARQQSIPPQLEPFRDLAIGQQFNSDPRFNPNPPMPMQQFPQQPFRNDSGFPSNQFPPQQGFPQQFQSPGFVNGTPGPQWGGINPQQGMHSRLGGGVGAFGTPGMPSPIGAIPAPFPPQNAFSPSIGQTLNRGPDFFSPSIGVGSIPTSPWATQGHPQGPQSHQLQQPFQEQSHVQHQQPINPGPWQQASPMQQMSQSQSQTHSQPTDQPSYFPSDNQETLAPVDSHLEQSDQESESIVEDQLTEDPMIASQQTDPTPQNEQQVSATDQPSSGPPPSAWALVPAVSRKSSVAAVDPLPIAGNETTDVQTPSKLAPAPASASLPSKPVAAPKQSVSENTAAAPAATATPDKAAPKAAPWASDKEVKTPSGPSLREIQQAESKVAEARKQALAEARANNAVPSPALSTADDMPTSMSWGLPSQNSKAPQVSTPSATASPSTPVWGSGEASAPKKTMKQIQDEEEKRRVKLAQAKAQAQGSASGPAATSTPVAKRGYADLAATSAPPGAGWQTVGASGKGVPGAASPAPGSRVASVAKPAVISTPTKVTPAPAPRVVKPTIDDSTPSVEFIRWTKQSLNGLNVNIDDFIQMLLSFPVDPPASERAGQLEIISDSVYSNSSTLDGRRFAQEFCTRRKADAKRSNVPNPNGSTPAKATSLADVLKTQPKPQSSDAGFKIVKAKGKKKN